MNDPRIPALLVSHRRPGFYFRVLEEGEVQAGDEIVKVASGQEQMTVAEVDALLYLPGHPRQQLLRALRIAALSPGWQASFRALLDGEPGGGNAGLAVTSPPPAWPGFRRLTVAAIERESDVRDLHPPRGSRAAQRCPRHAPASTSRCGSSPTNGQRSVLRNYSMSGPPGAGSYRITVKREPDGVASGYLHTRLAVGDQLDIAAPRGTFILDRTHAPVLLISAGIGATPVLAMLHALAAGAFRAGDLVAARRTQPPRAPLRRRGAHAPRLAPERPRPTSTTAVPVRTTARAVTSTAPAVSPRPCSPSSSRRATPRHTCAVRRRSWRRSAPAWPRSASTPSHIHTEPFGPAPGLTPGIASTPARAPHPPAGEPGSGPTIEFARSNLAIPWSGDYASLLELAEACDVPVRWSCRTGVCHNCETTLIAGTVDYDPDPVEPPADGSALICCSRPRDDVVLDL